MIRQVDSSLLDEWEKMRDPNYQAPAATKEVRPPGAEAAAADITRDPRAFTAAIRTRIFTLLRGLVNGDWAGALTHLDSPEDGAGVPWTPERLHQALEGYYAEHAQLRLDPGARNARHTYVTVAEDQRAWRVQQMLVDPEEDNDWVAEFSIDLAQSRAEGRPWLRLQKIGSLV